MFQGKHSDLTEKVIGAFYEVYNALGYGFSEKVYENALAMTLRGLGVSAQQQRHIPVYFAGRVVGE